jgi:hypothetical protein
MPVRKPQPRAHTNTFTLSYRCSLDESEESCCCPLERRQKCGLKAYRAAADALNEILMAQDGEAAMRFVFNSLKTRKATSMNEPFDPKAVNDKARDSYRRTAAQFEEFARDAEVPKAMREIARKKHCANARDI